MSVDLPALNDPKTATIGGCERSSTSAASRAATEPRTGVRRHALSSSWSEGERTLAKELFDRDDWSDTTSLSPIVGSETHWYERADHCDASRQQSHAQVAVSKQLRQNPVRQHTRRRRDAESYLQRLSFLPCRPYHRYHGSESS